MLLCNNYEIQEQLDVICEQGDDFEMIYLVVINFYLVISKMFQFSIVVVDIILVEFKCSYMVWSWFVYVLVVNLLLVIFLLWVVVWWSLWFIELLVKEVCELEEYYCEKFNFNIICELIWLVSNFNCLVCSECECYDKYCIIFIDFIYSLKMLLVVMQSILCLLCGEKISVDEVELVMLEQISCILQQIGYYLYCVSMCSGGIFLSWELYLIVFLFDSLIFVFNKVYQCKGVNILFDILLEIIFVGEQNDFMEVMGNVFDNVCKYCLEFVEVFVCQIIDSYLYILVEDDGLGILQSQCWVVFDCGQWVDILCFGQGVGFFVVCEIVE